MHKYFQQLSDKKFLFIFLLGFSSGLPLALTGSTLQAWYTAAGIDLLTVGSLTLVGQPYVYKFLWAPLLDRFSFFNLDRRRSWILVMQILLIGGLGVIAYSNPVTHPKWLAFVALLVALFSATQDIAIDAYRAEVLTEPQYGFGSSLTNLGYRLAMIVSGAVALILADKIGWKLTYLLMAALLAFEVIVTLFTPKPPIHKMPKSIQESILEPFREFMSRPHAICLLVFIVIYKLTDSFGLSLTTPFLIRGLGFSLTEVGAIAKLSVLIGGIAGALAGGLIYPKLGMYRSLLTFGILQSLGNLSFIGLAMIGKSYSWMAFAMLVDNFCSGLGSIAIGAFLMALCDKEFTATQFALFSALSAVGRVFVGPVAAVTVEHVGWPLFYLFAMLLGLPALLLLGYLRNRVTVLTK